jgi:hypothetical protein
MPETWLSTREALAQRIAESGLSWDKLAEQVGRSNPTLQRFYVHGGGLNTASTDRLLDYFNLAVTEAPTKRRRPKRKGR